MLFLIELYDSQVPLNNFLLTRVLKPDELVLIVPAETADAEKARERFESFRRHFRLPTELTIVQADTSSVSPVAESLKRLIRLDGAENCVIGLIGGSEVLLAAAGMCIAEYPALRAVTVRNAQPELIWGNGMPRIVPGGLDTALTVRDLIAASAGELIGCGHADWREIDETAFSLIPPLFSVYMRNRGVWPSFVGYLQRLNNEKYRIRDGLFGGPLAFTVNPETGKKVRAEPNILKELSDLGVIRECRLSAVTGRIGFSRPDMLRFLCDTGSWLELYVFTVLRASRLFSDIEINAVISWDNDPDSSDTTNEVDLIAVRGITPVFISCKSGIPDAAAVNEIWTIRSRFGNRLARAVLVTACDIQRDAPAVAKRCAECGVTVVDSALMDKEALKASFKKLFSTAEA